MKKLQTGERKREARHDSLVRFLKRTQDGEYADITSSYVTPGRLPNYTITDYEEEAYIFSYS